MHATLLYSRDRDEGNSADLEKKLSQMVSWSGILNFHMVKTEYVANMADTRELSPVSVYV
jgi:hypothetical protein